MMTGYSKHAKEYRYVQEKLAKAKYDMLIQNDHDNFIQFIYDCIVDEAEELQHYAEYEMHEELSMTECFHLTIRNIQDSFMCCETRTIKDYMCVCLPDNYSPYYHRPLVFAYDTPEYDYR